MTIAQPFKVGCDREEEQSVPKGRLNSVLKQKVSRPFGTYRASTAYPTLKGVLPKSKGRRAVI
jgi:hypothetical protein